MIKLMDILLEGNAKRERRYLKNELKEPFILMNGDILSTIDYKTVYNFSN